MTKQPQECQTTSEYLGKRATEAVKWCFENKYTPSPTSLKLGDQCQLLGNGRTAVSALWQWEAERKCTDAHTGSVSSAGSFPTWWYFWLGPELNLMESALSL